MKKIFFILLILSNLSHAQVAEIVKDINTKDEEGGMTFPIKMGSSLYFISHKLGESNAKIFKTDGSIANTTIVKDFTDNLYDGYIYVTDLVLVGTNIYFKVHFHPNVGQLNDQLWKTDGTTLGTVMVKDFLNYPFMDSYCALGNLLIFQGSDQTNGRELWKSDGTLSGTVLVKDFDAVYSGNPSSLVNLNGVVYFEAYNSTSGRDLWKTDGTTIGTTLVKDLPTNDGLKKMTLGGSKIYFVLRDNTSKKNDLWSSDGSNTGTIFIKQISINDSFYDFDICFFSGYLFFSSVVSSNNTLWKTDGTLGGTSQVYSNNLGTSRYFKNLTKTDNKLFFELYNSIINKGDLFVTDGTPANTISLAPSINVNGNMGSVGNILFFDGEDINTGKELYKSDGTALGTVLVKDIIPGTDWGRNGGEFAEINNKAIFPSKHPNLNYEPFVSDGTSAGTFLLFNTQAKGLGSFPTKITKIGSRLYFSANSGNFYNDPWYSDGTANGTLVLKNLQAENGGPLNFLDIDGTNFFFGTEGNELFKSDGSANGTLLVGPYNMPGTKMVYLGSKLYFAHSTNSLGAELYKYESGNISLIKDIYPNGDDSTPNQLTILNSSVYFFAEDGIKGRELWKSDGTLAGTAIVEDVRVGSGSSLPSVFGTTEEKIFNFNNNLYFLRYNGSNCNFYKSTGSNGGLTILNTWTQGEQFVDNFYVFNNQLYFIVIHNSLGITELWKTDGSPTGTSLVKEISSGVNFSNYTDVKTFSFITHGNKFYFKRVQISGTPRVLSFWCSDGTAVGTISLATYNLPLSGIIPFYTIEDTENNAVGFSPTELMFTFFDATHGLEIWKTDGTVANTQFFYDLNSGQVNANPYGYQSLNNIIYFTATNEYSGQELWKFVPATGIFESITTGNWNVGSTWISPSNTLLPSAAANAKINASHTVSIPNIGNEVKNIQMNGGVINLNGGTLEIKNQ